MQHIYINRASESYASSEILFSHKCVFNVFCFYNTHTNYSKGFKVLHIYMYIYMNK